MSDKKKKIAFDGQVLMDTNKSGIGIVATEMIKALVKKPSFTYQINAFSLGRTEEQLERLQEVGVPKENIRICKWFHRGIYLRMWHYLAIPFRWLFSGDDADVYVFWNYDTPPGVKGKAIVYVHDMTYLAYPETMDEDVLHILRRNMKDTCKRADVIVAVSEFTKQEIIKYLSVPEEKIRVIPNGVDQENYRIIDDDKEIAETKKKYGIEDAYFLYVGTIEPRKNIELLVHAYAKARRDRKDFPQLVFAGKKGWRTEKIYETARSYGIEGALLFTGYVPSEDLPILMNGATAFVFPSVYEGFGIPPLEAMACGTPVIVSDRASLPEVVGDAGMVVPVDTEEPLAAAMCRMVEEASLREQYREKGLAHVKKYTWDRAANRLAEICEGL
jgi:glycosyltransferase involved in cell wall biosynthesis